MCNKIWTLRRTFWVFPFVLLLNILFNNATSMTWTQTICDRRQKYIEQNSDQTVHRADAVYLSDICESYLLKRGAKTSHSQLISLSMWREWPVSSHIIRIAVIGKACTNVRAMSSFHFLVPLKTADAILCGKAD